MSYAHEIFGIRETRHDIWMQDLMLAGTSSLTFNSSDRMREIAASPFVKDSGFSGYYLMLWCKHNNIKLNTIMRAGQKVAIQNSDYGTVDNYILVNITDTALDFVSANYVGFTQTLIPGSTFYDGDPSNTLIGMWLKSEIPNWCSSIATSSTGSGAFVADYAYGHGIPEELKDILNRNTSKPKYFYPVIHDEPYFLFTEYYKLGVRNHFGNTAMYEAKLHGMGSYTNVELGHEYWTVILPTSSTETNAYPKLSSVWLGDAEKISSITDINSLTVKNLNDGTSFTVTETGIPNLNSYVPHLAMFSVEI